MNRSDYKIGRFIDDKETREDIVSDVFTSLWDKIDSFDFQSDTALGYIKMCVKNSCLNYLKHQEYEWNYAEVVQKKAPIYEVEPDSVYTLDELYRMLYETLNKLPESYRTVFIKSLSLVLIILQVLSAYSCFSAHS